MDRIELRAKRKALGLNQAEFGARLRVSNVAVSQWEIGAVPVPGYVDAYFEALETPPPEPDQQRSRV